MEFKRRNKEKKPIHNSIQIWYDGKENADVILDLDVNIWRIKTPKTCVFMDFGLKIEKSSDIKRAYIYFPFVFDKDAIFDLGKTFENAHTLQGIFNENYVTSTNSSNPKNILVKDDVTNNILFSIYKFNVNDDFKVENSYGGTIISFKVKDAKETKTRYYRFRISIKEYSPFIEHHRPKNTFFESAFIETELLDFRINEKRNQDPSLIEKITEKRRFKIDNINLFVMTSIKDDIISDGINLIYKRQLEMDHFWKEYLEIDYDKMSVYKCNNVKKNEQGSIDDFSCFAKINYRKSNVFTIIKYLLMLLLTTVIFSVCANIISDIIWHYIEPIGWRRF